MSARLASLSVAMLLLLGGGAALLSRDEAPRSEAEEVSAQLQRAPAVVAALPDVVAPAAPPAPDASMVEATPPDALPVPTPTEASRPATEPLSSHLGPVDACVEEELRLTFVTTSYSSRRGAHGSSGWGAHDLKRRLLTHASR